MIRKPQPVYSLLIVAWCLIMAWQAVEHHRVTTAARDAVIQRSKDIAGIISGVIGSATFRGIVLQDRLESALSRLLKPGDLVSAALLNVSNEVVAFVGQPVTFELAGMLQERERWSEGTVTFINPVDVGVGSAPPGETNRPPIVMPRREEDRPRPRGEGGPGEGGGRTNFNDIATPRGPPPEGDPPERRPGRGRFGRPPWMNEGEFKSLLERRGLHGLVIVMSTATLRHTRRQDLWMRWLIGCFASVSAVGLGLAWRNIAKSAELQMRLLRASELNTHLKEMNLAAAGLAHETRNPLNIIRGLAQMISRQTEAPAEVRARSHEIVEETDRVAAQLNEFINYSRPREVRRAPIVLRAVINDVARALDYDIEEKRIQLRVIEEGLTVEVDEQLLRQTLFNLLLNAIQAVEPGGSIEIVGARLSPVEASIEVRDNGPGVPPEQRAEIFKPYFTTHEQGTGLGLAVVQQIVLAHGWEIECLPHFPRGAVFRISHLALCPNPGNAG